MTENKQRKKAAVPLRLAQLYERYGGLMFSIARKLLGTQWDAEDAVHDALLKLGERMPEPMDTDSAAAKRYVTLTVKRVCIDHLRKKKPNAMETEEGDDGASPEGQTDLAWCMEQLSPKDREILLLRFYYGYSVRELAQQMRLSEDAVRKREQRAKRRLQELCEEVELL